MKTLILSLSVLAFSRHSLALSEGPCSNFAKYGAIKAYKTAHNGAGSLSASAQLKLAEKKKFEYKVILQEPSGAGASYMVSLKSKGEQCSVTSVSLVPEKTVCENLYSKAEETCTVSMCEEAKQNGYECEIDGDYQEGLQICAYDEMPALVEAYNAANPGANLNCEDY